MSRLDPPRLIHLQVRLEYQVDSAGQLVPFSGSEEQARFIVYRHARGCERFFRYDLPAEQLARLAQLDPAAAFGDQAVIASILGRDMPAGGFPVFTSGVIIQLPDQEISGQSVLRAGCWVIEVMDSPVAWAWSVRSNVHSAELAVEVEPEHRRKGYGRQVAAAWAHQVLEAGQVAFYSYKATNLPSQALARSLGVEVFADCVAFD